MSNHGWKSGEERFLARLASLLSCHMLMLTPCATAHSGFLFTADFRAATEAPDSAKLTSVSSTFIDDLNDKSC